MRLRFYRTEELRWYVDLPDMEFSEEEREMVSGADTMLDILDKGYGEVVLQVSEEELEDADMYLYKVDEDATGGYYMSDMNDDNREDFEMWLCNVTSAVFGKFPEDLYIKRI